MNIIKVKELVSVTAGIHSHGQFQIVLFLLHCLCLWLSQCGPETAKHGELTRSTVIWHGVTDSVIMHTRSLWLLTQHLWDGSEDPVAHPHQLIFSLEVT